MKNENGMHLKILLVDDDKKLRSVLKSLLVEDNHEVTTCQDGLDAIQKCREQKFDLVITDLMMPGANGLKVLKETRTSQPDTLVVLITGFGSLETAIQAIREGAYDYITKPFKLEEIKVVINNAGEKILLIRENQRLFQDLQEAYKQLHTVKEIIGIEKSLDKKEEKLIHDIQDHEPLFAGSMLPHYYKENKKETTRFLFSDLERLSALKYKGYLSEEEFSLCKSKLLENINN